MSSSVKFLVVSMYAAVALGMTGCSTLTTAYDSVSTTVSDVFKTDEAKK